MVLAPIPEDDVPAFSTAWVVPEYAGLVLAPIPEDDVPAFSAAWVVPEYAGLVLAPIPEDDVPAFSAAWVVPAFSSTVDAEVMSGSAVPVCVAPPSLDDVTDGVIDGTPIVTMASVPSPR